MRFSQKQFRHFQKHHSQFRAKKRHPFTKMRLPSGTVGNFIVQNLDAVNYSAKASQHLRLVHQLAGRYFHRLDHDHVQVDRAFLAAIEAVPNPHYYANLKHRNGRVRDNRPENLRWVP